MSNSQTSSFSTSSAVTAPSSFPFPSHPSDMDDTTGLSHPCAMEGSTEKNTSPVSAFLRALAMCENRYDRKRKADEVDGSEGAPKNVQSLLGPLDEWMSLPDENQGSLILGQSLLVTSPGLIKAEDDDCDDETPYSGQEVKDLLGLLDPSVNNSITKFWTDHVPQLGSE